MITGQISTILLIAGIPYVLGARSILWGKHIDQQAYVSRKKIRTMPVIPGTGVSRIAGSGIVILTYITVLITIAVGYLSLTCAIIVIGLPAAYHAIQKFQSQMPEKPPEGFVGWPLCYHRGALIFNKRFGWSYILSFAVAAVLIHVGFIDQYIIL